MFCFVFCDRPKQSSALLGKKKEGVIIYAIPDRALHLMSPQLYPQTVFLNKGQIGSSLSNTRKGSCPSTKLKQINVSHKKKFYIAFMCMKNHVGC